MTKAKQKPSETVKSLKVTPSKRGKRPNVRKVAEQPSDGKLAQGNQWQATKQQQDWLKYYMSPHERETWGNAYQSAIKAGYSESYARHIMSDSTAVEWVQQARNIMRLNPEHLKLALATIIADPMSKDSDKIQAIKLLGQDQGLFVPKQLIGIVPLEQALNELV